MKYWYRHIFASLLLLLLTGSAWADTRVETGQLQLQFSEQGFLQQLLACHPDCSLPENRRFELLPDAAITGFSLDAPGNWKLTRSTDDKEQVLEFKGPEGASLRWTIPNEGYGLALNAQGAGDMTLRAGDSFRPRQAPGFGKWLEQIRYLAINPEDVRQISLDDTEFTEIKAEWSGFRSRFWAVLVTAEKKTTWSIQTAEHNTDPVMESSSSQESMDWFFYFGPVERSALAKADELLPNLMYAGLWFWLRWICQFLAILLGWIQSVVGLWGPSIMVLSACVGFLMLPLTRLADQVQQQVNRTEARLAPELGRIKKEFKGEQQAAKIIALYKTERVHPLYSLKSLLGVAIVIPVFIGAFDMLAENINLMNTSFLWISDLSRPDDFFQLPVALPFFGSSFNLLPVLMTALSVWASALHRPLALQADLRQKQVRNMTLLAAAFFVLFYTFPAGMVLYWTTNNLISVIKNLWARWSTVTVQTPG